MQEPVRIWTFWKHVPDHYSIFTVLFFFFLFLMAQNAGHTDQQTTCWTVFLQGWKSSQKPPIIWVSESTCLQSSVWNFIACEWSLVKRPHQKRSGGTSRLPGSVTPDSLVGCLQTPWGVSLVGCLQTIWGHLQTPWGVSLDSWGAGGWGVENPDSLGRGFMTRFPGGYL